MNHPETAASYLGRAVDLEDVKRFVVDVLGYNPDEVVSVTIAPHQITVKTFHRDDAGNLVIDDHHLVTDRHIHLYASED